MKAQIKSILSERGGGGALRSRLLHGAFYSVVGSVFAQGIGFATTIAAARILGRTDFGVFGLITTTVTTVALLAGMSLGLTVTRHLAELRSEHPERAGTLLGLGLSVALISGATYAFALLLLADLLAHWALNNAALAYYLRVAAIQMLLATLDGVLMQALLGLEAFRYVAIGNAVKACINMVALPCGALLWGVEGAVVGSTVGVTLGAAVDYLLLRRVLRRWGIRLQLRGAWSEARVLRDFTLPSFLASAMVGPGQWAAAAILANQPQGYAALGVFTLALTFQRLLLAVAAMVDAAVLPLICSLEGRNSDRLRRFNILASWILGCVVALPLFALPEVIGWVGGPQYIGESTRQVLVLVILYTCIQTYKQGLTRVLVAEGRMWWSFISGVQWALVLIAAAWALVGNGLGAVGLAAAYIIAWATNIAIFIPLYQRLRLVPPITVVSREAAVVWFVLAMLAALAFFDVPIVGRLVLACVAATILYKQFKSLLKN